MNWQRVQENKNFYRLVYGKYMHQTLNNFWLKDADANRYPYVFQIGGNFLGRDETPFYHLLDDGSFVSDDLLMSKWIFLQTFGPRMLNQNLYYFKRKKYQLTHKNWLTEIENQSDITYYYNRQMPNDNRQTEIFYV